MDEQPAESTGLAGARTGVLLIAVFTIATCGLIYELLAGTIASYLLGDSVTQFSTVIGVYLFSMGVGSYLSRYFQRDLIARFIEVEILVGLVGGLSSPVLFFAFGEVGAFRVVLYAWVTATGVLVGLEIPFLIRILKDEFPLHDLVSRVLSLDYLGALAASLVFPLWLVPQVGLMRSSFVFGGLNVLVAVWTCHVFRRQHGRPRLTAQAWAVLGVLVLGAAYSDDLVAWSERRLYDDPVVLSRSSPYQRLVLTRGNGGVQLFLDGNLQFSSLDEYRYHEALVHPGLASVANPRRALVLGGGDGMAVREILKDDRVETVTLVDLDPLMTEIFRDHDALAALNDYALRSPRVDVVNADAFVWVESDAARYDFIAVDFPDPRTYSLGKLYTTTFYRRLRERLRPGGVARAPEHVAAGLPARVLVHRRDRSGRRAARRSVPRSGADLRGMGATCSRRTDRCRRRARSRRDCGSSRGHRRNALRVPGGHGRGPGGGEPTEQPDPGAVPRGRVGAVRAGRGAVRAGDARR